MGPIPAEERSEIAFFDLETTVPTKPGLRFAILEFGSILVCPRKLVELRSYSTLVRPADLSLISSLSVRCNGITHDNVVSAPTFAEIADTVYDILHGRIWAGHNILRFDCARIREAFAEIGRPPPEPKATIDSLALLTQKFGRRAGNMKMATLATYFGLGQQTHRSLDDVRMNLEVLKYCATVLFLESSLPDMLPASSVSPRTSARRRNPKISPEKVSPSTDSPPLGLDSIPGSSTTDQRTGENHPIISLLSCCNQPESSDSVSSTAAKPDPFDMSFLRNEMTTNALHSDIITEEKSNLPCGKIFSPLTAAPEGSSGYAGFMETDEVSVSDIKATLVPYYRGSQRIKLFHREAPLQLCSCLKVRFGIGGKFHDNAGRPKLNFVVDLNPSLCKVLEACDGVAKKLSDDSGCSSDWRSVITRKGFVNYPTARIHIRTELNGDIPQWATEIHQRDSSGTTQKIIFSKIDSAELEPLFNPGMFLDVFFSLEPYDYQQRAGIRLVAEKLVIHSEP